MINRENQAAASSCICNGTVIKGEVISTNDITVDGRLEGKLTSKGTTVIGENAEIVGDIDSANVEFYGKIKGDICVSDVLKLKNTASVSGNIRTRKLQVDLGAQLNGSCHMFKSPEPSEPVVEEVPASV